MAEGQPDDPAGTEGHMRGSGTFGAPEPPGAIISSAPPRSLTQAPPEIFDALADPQARVGQPSLRRVER